MSEGLNTVTLFGNLGADPELKLLEHGPALNMRLATSYSVLDREKNTRETKTEWHNVVVYGSRAQSLAKYLHKGSKVLVQGFIRTRSYEKDGQKRYITEVVVDELRFGDARPNGAYVPAPREAPLGGEPLPF